MVAKGTGGEIRKSRPERVRNWTIRANKMKRKKRPWSIKQDVMKVKATRQFKLKTQILRFNSEASSPAARMALMRSNKRFKPGD